MKAWKIAILGLGLLSPTLKADTVNFGVSVTANIGGSGVRGGAQLMGMDYSTNAVRMVGVDANGNILTAAGTGVTWTSSAGYVSVWTVLSATTRVINAPTVVNLTNVAGTSGIMKYQFSSSNSASAGVYWVVTANSTWVPPVSYYATSTTPIVDDNLAAGTHLNLSPVSATDISNTVQIIVSKLSSVAP